jgi:hypothetical protein
MAVGRLRKRHRLAVVHEASALPGRYAPDLGRGDAGRLRRGKEWGKLLRRQRQ